MSIGIARGVIRCRSGNIAVLSALLFLPMVVMLGGAVDLLRITSSKALLQKAVEAGALAAASLTNQQPEAEIAEAYVISNIGSDPLITNLAIQVPEPKTDRLTGQRQVEVKATAEVPLTFLQLIRMRSHPISVSAIAVEGGNIEVAMVLDVSTSMARYSSKEDEVKGVTKLSRLKEAATDFTELLLSSKNSDNISMSIIPFGETVNIGSALFKRYVVPKRHGTLITVGEKVQYKVSENTPKVGYRFKGAKDTKCIELAADDYDIEDIPTRSRSQVRPEVCPSSKNTAIWNTNKLSELKSRIMQMKAGGNTGMDQGVAWGAKALSPKLKGKLGGKFRERPLNFSNSAKNSGKSDKAIKVMVLMSDGQITDQGRYEETLRSDGSIVVIPRTMFYQGDNDDEPGRKTTIGFYKRICSELKANGVVVYTIGYELTNKDDARDAVELLRSCATEEALYFDASTGNIAEVFSDIAMAITRLRISG